MIRVIKWYIDSSDVNNSNWTRYINGTKTESQYKKRNVEFVQKTKRIAIVSTKNIREGSELLVDYGKFYW